MAGPSGKTARRELPFPLLVDTPDAEKDIKLLAEALDQFAKFNSGLLAARPEVAASKEGDIYWATNDFTYGPTGTWWVLVAGAWKAFTLPTVVAAMIAAEAIETAAIKALAVTEPKLGEESVTTPKLKALAVTAAKIAEATITGIKLAAESVGTAALVNLSVTAAKIAKETITAEKIALKAIGDAQIAASRLLVATGNVWGTFESGAIAEFGNHVTAEFSSTRPAFATVSITKTSANSPVGSISVGGAEAVHFSQVGEAASVYTVFVPPGSTITIASSSGAFNYAIKRILI